jgi:hypothetical protein
VACLQIAANQTNLLFVFQRRVGILLVSLPGSPYKKKNQSAFRTLEFNHQNLLRPALVVFERDALGPIPQFNRLG